MTTPDIRGLSEELGIVEVVSGAVSSATDFHGFLMRTKALSLLPFFLQYGASISTFTRTITLALHHTGLPFVFRHHLPHSAEIKEHNPLGLVPVLIHRPNALYSPKDSVILYESNAIRRYIDDALITIARTKKTDLPDLNPHLDSTNSRNLLRSAALRASVDQVVSLASTTVFTALEGRVIKPRQSLESNGADDATIGVALEEGLEGARLVLKLLEDFFKDNQKNHGAKGEWFVGDSITWADLYVYPIFADLKSIPEGPQLLAKTPLLSAWVDRMEATQIAKATYSGSVPDHRQREAKSKH